MHMHMSQEGGTTATALIIHANGVIAAWVGDSRAVLAEEVADASGGAGASGLKVFPLTTDHNTADEGERARLEKAGGKMGLDKMSSHVMVGSAEGSLKVKTMIG